MSLARLLAAVRHPPLRLKITAVFATAMAVLLAGLGLYVYTSFTAGLDRSIDQGLRSRTSDVRALVMQADRGLAEAGRSSLVGATPGFAQILRADGRTVDATPGVGGAALLTATELARARTQPLLVPSRPITAAHGPARLLASPVRAQGQPLVIVVGTALHDRASALGDLRAVLLVGGPIALLIAALLGYGASALSLRSVEALRRQARRLSLAEPGQRLSHPAARDELSRLAETLNEMLARNEATYRRQQRFVADASHELRSPLAVLSAEVELALSGRGSEGDLRAALASVADESGRLSQLAEDLLTLAQADDDKLPIEPAAVPVKATLERIRQRFGQRAALADRTILASSPQDATVWADPLRVEQALSNLVDNALRHGRGDVVLFADCAGGSVDLHVADSGPGFPPEFLDRAFERFSRPDGGRSSEGTGLGLAIVQSIAHAHGGEAHLANRASGGAEVWLSLPRTPRPQPSSQAGRRAAAVAIPA